MDAPPKLLTPGEAEAVIDECVERFGLDVFPEVTVTALPDGKWRVRWEHLERVVEPMTITAWRAWLNENIGSLDPGDLQTTES